MRELHSGADWKGDQQRAHPAINTAAKIWRTAIIPLEEARATQQQSRRHSAREPD
jgi:hypothetical protein